MPQDLSGVTFEEKATRTGNHLIVEPDKALLDWIRITWLGLLA
jgi:hypothetical protein